MFVVLKSGDLVFNTSALAEVTRDLLYIYICALRITCQVKLETKGVGWGGQVTWDVTTEDLIHCYTKLLHLYDQI